MRERSSWGMSVEGRRKRDDSFEKRIKDGDTLQEIADDFGLTRERVRQVLASRGIRSDWLKRRHEAAEEKYRERLRLYRARKGKLQEGDYERMKRDGIPTNPRSKGPHGSIVRYAYHGCRCKVCRRANTERHRKYMLLKKQRKPGVNRTP